MARHGVLGPEWRDDDAIDEHARLYLPLAGRGTLRCDGEELPLRPGSCLLLPPFHPRTFRCPRRLEIAWVHCQAEVAGLNLFDHWPTRRALAVDVAAYRPLFAALAAHVDSPEPSAVLAADGIVRQLLAPFLLPVDAAQARAHERLRAVLAFVDTHLAERLTLAGLARIAHLAESHFSRLFHATYGVPPLRYVRQRRIERVRALLATSGDTLDAIAARTGFSDGFHCSRVFLAVTGERPSRWRERSRQAAVP
ncbi:MAG: AraC family transcriptional regulator [Planctomycetota bacterium]|nr:AraC family transcriptional regulator [Planctomycetota bacterium]